MKTIMRERKRNRLLDYDYSAAGAYFITLCTHTRECLFGEIINGKIKLNEYGEIAMTYWEKPPHHYGHCRLDEYVIMPNHLHGIIVITNFVGNGLKPFPTTNETQHHGLPEIVRGFKTYASKTINQLRQTQGLPVWQKSYYDRIIRNDRELHSIRKYIQNNPLKWAEDEENPEWEGKIP
ncbi:transposase [bacterium]|nr:transposase [bacterium]